MWLPSSLSHCVIRISVKYLFIYFFNFCCPFHVKFVSAHQTNGTYGSFPVQGNIPVFHKEVRTQNVEKMGTVDQSQTSNSLEMFRDEPGISPHSLSLPLSTHTHHTCFAIWARHQPYFVTPHRTWRNCRKVFFFFFEGEEDSHSVVSSGFSFGIRNDTFPKGAHEHSVQWKLCHAICTVMSFDEECEVEMFEGWSVS